MSEYRERKTGEVKTQGEWRAVFKNMSLPKVWNSNVCDAMNIDPVLPSPEATTSAYQISVRDGVEQNDNGDWVERFIARDMFADIEGGKTKAEQETEFQASLDAATAANYRSTRNNLLADTDWTQVNDSPLANDVKTQWAVYRSELRNITDLDEWPNLADEDWPIAP